MLEIWNDSSITPPPVHTSPGPVGYNIDIKQLSHICNTITKVLTKQAPLHKEGAILSRIIYKFDKKFRNDIGYRNFKKVNTALKKYLCLNIMKDIENFAMVLPSDEDDLYLPTRQMLEYVLIRLLTFSKIMLRISICAKQASVFYLDRIKRGESHWMSLMPYALLCRVWSMSKVLLQHSCHWYDNLYNYLDKLTLKGLPFLPASYSLPNDLVRWLDLDNLDNFGRFEWYKKKQIEIDARLVEDNEEDMFESILDFVNNLNQDQETTVENIEINKFAERITDNAALQVSKVKVVDHGEAISRDSFKSLTKAFEITKKTTHYVERVTNKNSLQEFIITEEMMRNENNKLSLTKHLSFMQWHSLKNALTNLLESLSNNRKIEKKFKKIWKAKCLEYL